VTANDDKILFLQIRQGNKSAFDTLFQKHYTRLCRFAFSFTKSGEIAEEAVQNTFVKIWCQRDSLEITSSVISYLYTAVRNHALNELKKINIRKGYEAGFAHYIEKETDNDQKLNKTGFKNFVKKAVEQLPVKCREIFMLSKNDGLTYEEISEYLEISKKTVENQMGIAFKKLREMLKPVLAQLIE